MDIQSGNIDAGPTHRHQLTTFPTFQIGEAETLQSQFDGTFTAHFEDDRIGDIREIVLLEISIYLGRLGRKTTGDTGTCTQHTDRIRPIRIRQRPQLGFCLGIVQQDFGIAEQRDRIRVQSTGIVFGIIQRIFDRLVSRIGIAVEVRGGRRSVTFIPRCANRLGKTCIAVPAFVVELHRLITGTVRERCSVRIQESIDERTDHTETRPVRARSPPPVSFSQHGQPGIGTTCQHHFTGYRFVTDEQ